MTIEHYRIMLDKFEKKLQSIGFTTKGENGCKIVNIEFETEESVYIEYRARHYRLEPTEKNQLETMKIKLSKAEMEAGFK